MHRVFHRGQRGETRSPAEAAEHEGGTLNFNWGIQSARTRPVTVCKLHLNSSFQTPLVNPVNPTSRFDVGRSIVRLRSSILPSAALSAASLQVLTWLLCSCGGDHRQSGPDEASIPVPVAETEPWPSPGASLWSASGIKGGTVGEALGRRWRIEVHRDTTDAVWARFCQCRGTGSPNGLSLPGRDGMWRIGHR